MTRRVLERQHRGEDPAELRRTPTSSEEELESVRVGGTLPPPRADPLPERIWSTAFGISIRPGAGKGEGEDESALTKRRHITVIRAGLLIPGDGEPLKDAALVIEDKLIAWVGPQAELPVRYTTPPHKSFSVPYLMPGLWDCHAHFSGEGPDEDVTGYATFISAHPASMGARLARSCWEALQRGYTSLRDVAGLGCELALAIDEGSIVGPNVYSSGAALSQTAGHGDVFALPAGDVLRNVGVSVPTPGHFGGGQVCLVDGVDQCRRAVRLQIRRGARCIKMMASGGVLSRDDNPLYAQFSPEELDCIVQEANRQGRIVAAHVHGKPGILAAIRAGATTLEHVSFADEECIALMKERGTVYIATRTIVDALLKTGGKGLSKGTWEKAKLCGSHHLTAYKMAVAAGLPIAMGTDTSPGANMAVELEYAVQAGMSNLEAIRAATAHGPLSVGKEMAPLTGQLKAGYEADVLGVTENPVEDVKVLQHRDNIRWVWKGGKLYKGPGVGPWGEE